MRRIFPKLLSNLPIEIQKRFDYPASKPKPCAGVSVIIPVRGADRLRNLHYCLNKLLQQNIEPLEIIVSEEDKFQTIDIGPFRQDSRIRHIFTRSSDGLNFNKSKAVNAGVVSASYNFISMNDADIILPKDYLYRVSNILQDYESCFIAKEIYLMDFISAGICWRGGKRVDYFTGGNISFRKDAFIKIGGMNEQFIGYGSEDCEFWTRIQNLTKLYESRDCPILHLNHARKHNYSQNSSLYEKIISKSMEERVAELSIDLKKHFKNIA
jgi:cellulose synthase/poly-beta-1,6-N-acetylglucosamine synthase-like glycosyltransferase